MIKHKLLLLLFIPLAYVGCRKVSESEDNTKINTDSLVVQLTILQDSINKTWQDIDKNENEVMFNINRLLDEVNYIKNHNPQKLAELKARYTEVSQKKVSQSELDTTATIDEYDQAKDSLIFAVNTYCYSLKNIEDYPLCIQLLKEIAAGSDKNYLNRVRYNFHIQDYNTFVSDNKQRLVKKNPSLDSLRERPKF